MAPVAPYPPGPLPYGSPGTRQPGPGQTSGFAIASLVFGIIGGILLSVIFGIVALVKIRRNPQLRGKGIAIAGLVLSGLWCLVLVAGIVVAVVTSPQRSATGRVTRQGTTDVFSLRAGDCFQNPSTQLGITNVTVIPCTQPHNAQVYAEFPVTGSGYPGGSALRQLAAQGCHARIRGHVNRSLVTNTMSLRFLYPEQQSWTDGQHSITCVIVDSSAGMTTSLLLPHPSG